MSDMTAEQGFGTTDKPLPDVNPDTDMIQCPVCLENRPMEKDDLGGPCKDCRAKVAVEQEAQRIHMPEVRHRRDMLIASSDWTQLPDIDSNLRAAYVAWRQKLRDVTQLEDPLKAWVELDNLDANRPSA